jgi:hypothetical protein
VTMSRPEPIACTLSSAEMPQRAADIRALGRDALLAVERFERRALLRFRPDRATRARVEQIVAAESECCGFMDFELSVTDAAIVLEVAAPPGGESAVHLLADLFAAGPGVEP